MRIQFLGHACFLLEDGTHKALVDPFLTGNPLAAISAGQAEADMIFVTHGHADHVGDTVDIAHRTGAVVCCPVELAGAVFEPAGIPVLAGNLGGWIKVPFGKVKLTPAIHGSGVPGGLACGFLFEMGGKRIYHAGDTALTCEMSLLAAEQVDVALLPIGDFYTMGPEDALRAVELIRPALTVPMHFNTMPPIAQDGAVFAAAAEAAGFPARVLLPGQSLEL